MKAVSSLKLALQVKGMSQTELARKTGIQEARLSRAINHPDIVRLRDEERVKISAALPEFDPNWLFQELHIFRPGEKCD